MSTPSVFSLLLSFSLSWIARTHPITTGSTVYRCEGLGTIVNLMFLSLILTSWLTPKWYLTSPEFPHSPILHYTFSWNSAKILSSGFWKTFARAESLPRWAIPRVMPFISAFATSSTNAFKALITVSVPSTPNLLLVVSLLSKNELKA